MGKKNNTIVPPMIGETIILDLLVDIKDNHVDPHYGELSTPKPRKMSNFINLLYNKQRTW
jgi:hypothetical protein